MKWIKRFWAKIDNQRARQARARLRKARADIKQLASEANRLEAELYDARRRAQELEMVADDLKCCESLVALREHEITVLLGNIETYQTIQERDAKINIMQAEAAKARPRGGLIE